MQRAAVPINIVKPPWRRVDATEASKAQSPMSDRPESVGPTVCRDPKERGKGGLIPGLVDHDPYAQSRVPIDMILQG